MRATRNAQNRKTAGKKKERRIRGGGQLDSWRSEQLCHPSHRSLLSPRAHGRVRPGIPPPGFAREGVAARPKHSLVRGCHSAALQLARGSAYVQYHVSRAAAGRAHQSRPTRCSAGDGKGARSRACRHISATLLLLLRLLLFLFSQRGILLLLGECALRAPIRRSESIPRGCSAPRQPRPGPAAQDDK